LLGKPSDPSGDGATGRRHRSRRHRAGARVQVDDIIDWLWEDLKLPNLQLRTAPPRDRLDAVRARQARRRSRLDRRRSLKESIKRRAQLPPRDRRQSAGIHDEDLRFGN